MKSRTRFGFALALLLIPALAGANGAPPDAEFPPTTALPTLTIDVGNKVSIGGPGSENFLPNEVMNVYIVTHRTWNEGDALNGVAVHRTRVKSDANGRLVLTWVWKADRAGEYDIIVDYDGNGRFSYSLDTVSAIVVKAK